MSRRTDSNGLAARPSACAATQRACGRPVRGQRSAADRSSCDVTRPERRAESATLSASSRSSALAQSTTVRNGSVTVARWSKPATGAQNSRQSGRSAGTRRLRGTVIMGRRGAVLTFHP
jgi:hypothetical protein